MDSIWAPTAGSLGIGRSSTAAEFVDTNVLVYAYDTSAGDRHRKASQLVAGLWRDRNGVISVQVLQELYVTLTRKIAKPLSPDEARDRIANLASWTVVVPDERDVLAAIDLIRRHSLSFWDAMIIRCAQLAGAPILWTEDLSHEATYDGVKAVNPFA